MQFLTTALVAAACVCTTLAHGGHASTDDAARPEDWATWHLEEEHHISNFDPTSFFKLHDFNNDGIWTTDEIRKTYGFDDGSMKNIALDTKMHYVKQVVALYDPDKTNPSGGVTRQQFLDGIKAGKVLPDFGTGPGHHGDMEYEYEIHHFEKFHGADAKEEDLTHPEDIEHFKLHDQLEDEELRIEIEQSQSIVEANIPLMFRKQGSRS